MNRRETNDMRTGSTKGIDRIQEENQCKNRIETTKRNETFMSEK